jgi:hypothetical protein
MKRKDIIAHEYRDDDGYWIEFKPGLHCGDDPTVHGIHEDTKRDAYSRLCFVEACACKECIAPKPHQPSVAASD